MGDKGRATTLALRAHPCGPYSLVSSERIQGLCKSEVIVDHELSNRVDDVYNNRPDQQQQYYATPPWFQRKSLQEQLAMRKKTLIFVFLPLLQDPIKYEKTNLSEDEIGHPQQKIWGIQLLTAGKLRQDERRGLMRDSGPVEVT